MPDSPVNVTASVNGLQSPSVFYATFSGPVFGVNTSSVVVTGPSGIVTGAAFFVPAIPASGPHFTAEDGTPAPALSVVFVPGAKVKAVPVCGTCRLNVENGTPTDELTPGQYTMTISGLTDARGRTVAPVTIGFSVEECFVASVVSESPTPGSTTDSSTGSNTAVLEVSAPRRLVSFTMTNSLGNVTGTLSVPVGGVSTTFSFVPDVAQASLLEVTVVLEDPDDPSCQQTVAWSWTAQAS